MDRNTNVLDQLAKSVQELCNRPVAYSTSRPASSDGRREHVELKPMVDIDDNVFAESHNAVLEALSIDDSRLPSLTEAYNKGEPVPWETWWRRVQKMKDVKRWENKIIALSSTAGTAQPPDIESMSVQQVGTFFKQHMATSGVISAEPFYS